jgi:hypothetical protein
MPWPYEGSSPYPTPESLKEYVRKHPAVYVPYLWTDTYIQTFWDLHFKPKDMVTYDDDGSYEENDE